MNHKPISTNFFSKKIVTIYEFNFNDENHVKTNIEPLFFITVRP